IGGRMLVLDSGWSKTQTSGQNFCGGPSTSSLNLVSESGSQVSLASYTELATSQACNPRYLNGEVTLTVNHPYLAAANGTVSLLGDYMDASTVKRVWYPTPLIIMHGFGDIGRGVSDKWSNVPERSMGIIFPPACEECSVGWLSAAGYARRIQLDANWLTQTSTAARLHAQIAGSTYALHHALGVVAGDTEVPFQRQLQSDSTYKY